MKNTLKYNRRRPKARAAAGSAAARFISRLASILFWIIIWFIAAKKIGHQVILPTPADVIVRLGELVTGSHFWICVANSFAKVIGGLTVGIALALPFAALAAKLSPIKELLDPPVITARATPVASFIILIWTVLGSRGPSLVPVFISILMVFPVVYSATYSALMNVDKELLEVAEIYRLSPTKQLKLLYFPSVFSSVITSFATAAGMAWKAGIAAEVLSQTDDSIGFEIYTSKAYLETVDLFAYTLTVIILSLAIELLLSVIKARFGDSAKGDTK